MGPSSSTLTVNEGWFSMGALKPWHIIVLVVVLILLFGAKRLPDASRALGRSLRILKAETRGLADDDVQAKAEAQNARQDSQQSIAPSATPVVDPIERVRDK
jgi:sec-independent protein translocase protein TatA